MGAIMGKDGSVSIAAAVVGYIDSWSITAGIGNAEVTSFGDPVRSYNYGIKEWSGSFSGTFDPGDAQQITLMAQATTAAFATVALRFNTTSPGYWGGTAYIKGYSPASRVGDKVSVTYSFQGTGNLAWTS